MKKINFILMFLLAVSALFAEPEIGAKAYLAADPETGYVIYSKNMDISYPMASTTKLMTCLCYLDNADLNRPVVYSQQAKDTPYPNMKFEAGTVLSSADALRCMMIPSSNDMATAIALNAFIDIKSFVNEMNRKARALGMKNTHYANVHGLDEDGHYSSCFDIYLLAKEIWKNPVFRHIPKASYDVTYTEKGTEKHRTVYATYGDMFSVDGFRGMKTGTTTKAGKCFVGYFDREPAKLITVVLGSKDAMADTKALVDYTYKNCERQTLFFEGYPFLLNDGETEFGAKVKSPVTFFAEKNAVWDDCFSYEIKPFVNYPVKEGDFVAILTIKAGGRPFMSVPLYSMSDVRKPGDKKAG